MKKYVILLLLLALPLLASSNDLLIPGTLCEGRIFCESHDIAGTLNDWVLEEHRLGKEQKIMLTKYLKEGKVIIEPSPMKIAVVRVDPSGRVALVVLVDSGKEVWVLTESLNCSENSAWYLESSFLRHLLQKS